MAAFLAFALLAHLGLNLALDTVRPQWRDPEYGHRLKRLKAAAVPGRPLVVVLGSSRSQMGLSPAHLGLDGATAFNCSQAGCGPVYELLNLRRLLADGVTPTHLIVEVLPPVLAGTGTAETLVRPERLSAADVRRLGPYAADSQGLWLAWAEQRVNPWQTYRLMLMSHWQGGWQRWQVRQDFQWTKMEPTGWLPYFYDDVPAAKREAGLADAHAQYSPYLAGFRVAELPRRAYAELVGECRARGIAVAFVVMPESPRFRAFYPPAAREKVSAYLNDLRADGLPVWDASGWLDDETAFADGHHPMRPAAEAVSARLGRECVGPWLAGQPPGNQVRGSTR